MLIRSSVFGVRIFMCFRKQITALGGFVGCMKYVRGPRLRAAAGPQLGPGCSGSSSRRLAGSPRRQGGVGEEGAFSSLTWGRDRPPYGAGPSPCCFNWGLSRSQPSSRSLLLPPPVHAEVSLLAVSAWKQ